VGEEHLAVQRPPRRPAAGALAAAPVGAVGGAAAVGDRDGVGHDRVDVQVGLVRPGQLVQVGGRGQPEAGPVAPGDHPGRRVPLQVAQDGVDSGVDRGGDVAAQRVVAERPQQAHALRDRAGHVVAHHHRRRLSRGQEPGQLPSGHRPPARLVSVRGKPGPARLAVPGPVLGGAAGGCGVGLGGAAGEPAQVGGPQPGDPRRLLQRQPVALRGGCPSASGPAGGAGGGEQRTAGGGVPPRQDPLQLPGVHLAVQADQVRRASAGAAPGPPARVVAGRSGGGLLPGRAAADVVGDPQRRRRDGAGARARSPSTFTVTIIGLRRRGGPASFASRLLPDRAASVGPVCGDECAGSPPPEARNRVNFRRIRRARAARSHPPPPGGRRGPHAGSHRMPHAQLRGHEHAVGRVARGCPQPTRLRLRAHGP
jgi:hypothetical protein